MHERFKFSGHFGKQVENNNSKKPEKAEEMKQREIKTTYLVFFHPTTWQRICNICSVKKF